MGGQDKAETGNELKISIPGNPVTKKNHQRILKTRDGRSFVAPSSQYKAYEEQCGWFIPKEGISAPVNVKCLYFMENLRRVDLVNLLEATCDILVKYGCLKDDDSKIVASHDGSRVLLDRKNPRVEITITPV